jgi:hypothetical protein
MNKAAPKLVPWYERNIIVAGRDILVKSVSTSQDIFHIAPSVVPPSALQTVNKIVRGFLWAGKDNASA